MDALAKTQTVVSSQQSLLSRWRDGRNELLQLYADLEIALGAALASHAAALVATAPDARTFGKKLNLAFKGADASKTYADLVPLRNLLAHAKAEVVHIGGEAAIILRVADLAMAMNARIIPERQLKSLLGAWRKMLNEALAEAGRLPLPPASGPARKT